MLEMKELVKRYGNFTAVDHLSLTVPDGSIYGFVGPNGAGKTTTMRIMAGLLRQTAGEVLYDGREMTSDRKFLKETVGYMPDFFGVYDNLKVKEYMDFFAGTYFIPVGERKALIDNFIDGVNEVSDVMIEWREYVSKERERQLNQIITEENLKPEETHKFIENSFRDGTIKSTGTDIDKILPPISRFGGGREKKKQSVLEKLKAFFERFFGIG